MYVTKSIHGQKQLSARPDEQDGVSLESDKRPPVHCTEHLFIGLANYPVLVPPQRVKSFERKKIT
jgi:hypothetical protein